MGVIPILDPFQQAMTYFGVAIGIFIMVIVILRQRKATKKRIQEYLSSTGKYVCDECLV